MAHSKGHASHARKLSQPRSLRAGLCQPPLRLLRFPHETNDDRQSKTTDPTI
jgi:hypothetical protein